MQHRPYLLRTAFLFAGFLGFAAIEPSCMSYDEGLRARSSYRVRSSIGATRSIRCSPIASRTATGQRLPRRPQRHGQVHGGDWKGLEDGLPYLQELGVTTLWISPIIRTSTPTRASTATTAMGARPHQLNPHFGDLAAMRSLVFKAHELR